MLTACHIVITTVKSFRWNLHRDNGEDTRVSITDLGSKSYSNATFIQSFFYSIYFTVRVSFSRINSSRYEVSLIRMAPSNSPSLPACQDTSRSEPGSTYPPSEIGRSIGSS
jgi:hypothetical protein